MKILSKQKMEQKEKNSHNLPENNKLQENNINQKTDKKLRKLGDIFVEKFCSQFEVEGINNIKEEIEKNPDAKYIISSSHFSNLDAPAAVKAMGELLDMQITAESLSFEGASPQKVLFYLGGKDNFIPLDYRRTKNGKTGVFNPSNFDPILERIDQNKTPWIAIHTFNTEGQMKKAKIGAVYTAQKSGAKIIPTALEFYGASVSLEGILNIAKGLLKRSKGKAVFHIGQPIKLEPIENLDILERVIEKRSKGEKLSEQDRLLFKQVKKQLQAQADYIGRKTAAMLPENYQGYYTKKE
ncbi:MAG: hypothetical protein WC570_03520 [Patescibacteria group bacterium]